MPNIKKICKNNNIIIDDENKIINNSKKKIIAKKNNSKNNKKIKIINKLNQNNNTNNTNNINNINILVAKLSNNFTSIISRDELKNYDILNWGNNGIGDRWANKKFNYTSISSNGKHKLYSENLDDVIDSNLLSEFINKSSVDNNALNKGIIGIFVHSKRKNIITRPIRKDISVAIKKKNCVSCGSTSDIICDHKNDIYNDINVLNTLTQNISDFQPLCNHCNLVKRQIFKDEYKNNKLYSAKNLEKYNIFDFEFPWEKKSFDIEDTNTKIDTYWYDPVEFNKKIYYYIKYKIPIINEIKFLVKKKKLIYFNNVYYDIYFE
jgi:hypothetical protein